MSQKQKINETNEKVTRKGEVQKKKNTLNGTPQDSCCIKIKINKRTGTKCIKKR